MAWNISGICAIAPDAEVKVFKSNKGAFLNFNIINRSLRGKLSRVRCSMWVPTDEVDQWMKDLKPLTVYEINGAELEVPDKSENEYTFTQVHLNRRGFVKQVVANWAAQNKQEK